MSAKDNMEVTDVKICCVKFVIFWNLTTANICHDCGYKVGVPCIIYAMQDCLFEQCGTDLEGLGPGKVSDVSVSNFIEEDKLGFNISFSLPRYDDRKSLQGVKISILRLQDGSRLCYCVDISKPHCIPEDLFPQLYMDCSTGWRDDSTYSIVLQSLPNSQDSSNYVQMQHNVGDLLDPVLSSPCTWQMTVYSFEVTSNSRHGPWDIAIEFEFAPKAHKLRKYIFSLVSNNHSEECSFIYSPLDSASVTNFDLVEKKGKVTLTTPYTGDQCIRIDATCGEDIWDDCEEHRANCSNDRPVTRIRIHVDDSTTAKKIQKREIKKYSQRFLEQQDYEPCEGALPTDPNLVAVVVPTVLFVITIGVATTSGIIYKKRKRKATNLKSTEKVDNIKLDSMDGISERAPGSKFHGGAPKTPKVLLIFSNDFKEFEKLNWILACFLRIFGLVVRCCLEETEASVNSFHWVNNSVEEVDKVLIIHSEGSHLRYTRQSESKKIIDKEATPQPDGFDNFTKSLTDKHLPGKTWKEMGKFVNARFEFTDNECVIKDIVGQAGVCVLPNHLEHLVAYLFDTTPYKADFPVENVDWKNFDKYQHGFELKVAIGNVEKFIKQNPKWIKQKFTSGPNALNDSTDVNRSPNECNPVPVAVLSEWRASSAVAHLDAESQLVEQELPTLPIRYPTGPEGFPGSSMQPPPGTNLSAVGQVSSGTPQLYEHFRSMSLGNEYIDTSLPTNNSLAFPHGPRMTGLESEEEPDSDTDDVIIDECSNEIRRINFSQDSKTIQVL